MKRNFLIFVILIGLYGCASRPFEGWTQADTTRQIIYTGEHLIDWSQTRQISENSGKYREAGLAGMFIGEHPSKSQVDLYFGATLLLQTAAPAMLKPGPRHFWQYLWIGAEGGTIIHNFAIGLHGAL